MYRRAAAARVSWASGDHAKFFNPCDTWQTLEKWDSQQTSCPHFYPHDFPKTLFNFKVQSRLSFLSHQG
jgi:hypothetical protein